MSSNTETTTTTQTIVRDYFHWRLIAQTLTQDRLCLLVRQIGYDCERTFTSQEPVFRFSCSTSTLIQLRMIHYEIGKELFRDGNITWTRIITFISFSALLTERVLEKQCQNRELIIDSFIDWTTNFIETDLHAWLENEGYWAGCLKIYDKTPQRRHSIGRYASILGTISMLTLGALCLNRI